MKCCLAAAYVLTHTGRWYIACHSIEPNQYHPVLWIPSGELLHLAMEKHHMHHSVP